MQTCAVILKLLNACRQTEGHGKADRHGVAIILCDDAKNEAIVDLVQF
jgi:hypothetical protein